jgi:signal transduction histidine kinase
MENPLMCTLRNALAIALLVTQGTALAIFVITSSRAAEHDATMTSEAMLATQASHPGLIALNAQASLSMEAAQVVRVARVPGTPKTSDDDAGPSRLAVIAMLSLSLALVLTLLYVWRVREVARQFEMRLEERVNERTRIARELHDSLLQGFQGLMFRLQAARDLLPTRPAEAAKVLDVAMERGDTAIAEGRQALQDLRSTSALSTDLVEALSSLGQELGPEGPGADATAYQVTVMGKPSPLAPLIRDELYRITREAVRNAFRHAQARLIEVDIDYGARLFTLRIRDDGIGIASGTQGHTRRTGHWGLVGMHERAHSFGAKLEVWSRQGAGTEVQLSLPTVLAYGHPRIAGSRRLVRRLRDV